MANKRTLTPQLLDDAIRACMQDSGGKNLENMTPQDWADYLNGPRERAGETGRAFVEDGKVYIMVPLEAAAALERMKMEENNKKEV